MARPPGKKLISGVTVLALQGEARVASCAGNSLRIRDHGESGAANFGQVQIVVQEENASSRLFHHSWLPILVTGGVPLVIDVAIRDLHDVAGLQVADVQVGPVRAQCEPDRASAAGAAAHSVGFCTWIVRFALSRSVDGSKT